MAGFGIGRMAYAECNSKYVLGYLAAPQAFPAGTGARACYELSERLRRQSPGRRPPTGQGSHGHPFTILLLSLYHPFTILLPSPYYPVTILLLSSYHPVTVLLLCFGATISWVPAGRRFSVSPRQRPLAPVGTQRGSPSSQDNLLPRRCVPTASSLRKGLTGSSGRASCR